LRVADGIPLQQDFQAVLANQMPCSVHCEVTVKTPM